MRKNIKGDILGAAKRLFNERGYNNVSTQDIAGALGISKGNLSYHFKRKEDIAEAIIEDLQKKYVRPNVPTSLSELHALFIHVQQVVMENAFCYWQIFQLSQLSEKVRSIQRRIHYDNRELLREAFANLQDEGSFKEEEYPGQYEHTIRTLIMTCIYWIPYCKLEKNTDIKDDFITSVWAVIYPLLTEKGKCQCRTLAVDTNYDNSMVAAALT